MSHPARSTLEPPDYDGHFVMIPLTRGKFVIVDEADAEMIPSFGRWRTKMKAKRNTCYAASCTYPPGLPEQTVYMHVLIAGFKGVDHVNRNGLDNRRINLRPATVSQNQANRGPLSNNTSGYKGVSWNRGRHKWSAIIKVAGEVTRLGFFDDPIEAARAYNQAASEAFGEYAYLNPMPATWSTLVSQPSIRPSGGSRSASRRRRGASQSLPSNNTSGYKGVTRHQKSGRWQARINFDGKYRYLGLFDDPLDAAHAYNEAAISAWGERAWLNPIPQEGFRSAS
jgi:hypothetical protein